MQVIASILVGILLQLNGQTVSVHHFTAVAKSNIPRALITSKPVCAESEEECWDRFEQSGEARQGDINDDGSPELIIFSGWGGSGGQEAFLFERRANRWVQILYWFPRGPRFDILPVARDRYHDLCLAERYCFKWARGKYVPFEARDYRSLLPAWFNAEDPDDAEMLWLIRYAGLRQIRFQPLWVDSKVLSLGNDVRGEARDQQGGARWVGLYKGGVWGVQGDRAFLLIPRPAYKGCERIELVGEWVVIYGEREGLSAEKPVAHYNPKTGELRIETKGPPFWLLEN